MDNEHNVPIKELKSNINKIKKRNKELSDHQDKEEASNGGIRAAKAGLELVAGVLAGGMLGYFLDNTLDTLPLFLIICFFLGAAGGMLNIYRLMRD